MKSWFPVIKCLFLLQSGFFPRHLVQLSSFVPPNDSLPWFFPCLCKKRGWALLGLQDVVDFHKQSHKIELNDILKFLWVCFVINSKLAMMTNIVQADRLQKNQRHCYSLHLSPFRVFSLHLWEGSSRFCKKVYLTNHDRTIVQNQFEHKLILLCPGKRFFFCTEEP